MGYKLLFPIFVVALNIINFPSTNGESYFLDTNLDYGPVWTPTCNRGYYPEENAVCNGLIPSDEWPGHIGFWVPCSEGEVHACSLLFRNEYNSNITMVGLLAYVKAPGRITLTITSENGMERDVTVTGREDGWISETVNVAAYAPIKRINIVLEYHAGGAFTVLDQVLITDEDTEDTEGTIGTTDLTPTNEPTEFSSIATSTLYSTSSTIRTSTAAPCASDNEEIQNEGLNNFLTLAFANFGDWLNENGLDPTPPIISPANVVLDTTFLKLNGTFRQTTAWGMSIDTKINSPASDFLTPEFGFWLHMSNLTLYGIYEAEGSIISVYPLSGSGLWTLTHFNLELYFHIGGFAIENGFININSFESRTLNLHPDVTDRSLSVPDLVNPEDADGLGQEVLEILKIVIPEQLHLQEKHPVAQMVLEYLNVIFSETPLTEIIGTTLPPCRQ